MCVSLVVCGDVMQKKMSSQAKVSFFGLARVAVPRPVGRRGETERERERTIAQVDTFHEKRYLISNQEWYYNANRKVSTRS